MDEAEILSGMRLKKRTHNGKFVAQNMLKLLSIKRRKNDNCPRYRKQLCKEGLTPPEIYTPSIM